MIIFKTQYDWVAAMKKAATYPTAYSAQYPYNLLFWTGSTLYADCVNFQKALFNGRNVYAMAANTYQNTLNNTGDVGEIELLNQCSDISGDFTKLKAGEPRILWMDGHIGAYCGEEIVLNGNVYNVIEWTTWAGDFRAGCIYSYVDQSGRRLNHKNGYQCESWMRHGKPTRYVDYVQNEPKWEQKWHLYDSTGKMLTGWQMVKSKWYYLDKTTGIMQTGWLKDGGKWYYLSSNGDMLTGWQKINNKWYYLTPKNDGTHLTGEMWTGWLEDKGKWYYLDLKNGDMYTGTHTIDGKTYTFDSSGALIS